MKKITPIIISVLALMLAACDGSDSGSSSTPNSSNDTVAEISCSTEGNITTAHIDASSQTLPARLNLKTCLSVGENDDWDVSFLRDTIAANQGKKTAIADKQEEYYEADGLTPASNGGVFSSATNVTELPSLLDATAILGSWIPFGVKSAIDGSWYISGHPLLPSSQEYILRSAGGNSFAKFAVDTINFTAGKYEIAFKFYVQGVGESQFSTSSVVWNVTSGTEACYDFDSAASVSCSDTTWDIKFGNTNKLPLYINGGVSGSGSAGVYKMASTDTYNSGSFDGVSGLPSQAYTKDTPAGAFSDYSWYAYDPLNDGMHQLYPNYRVYAIDTNTPASTIEGGWYAATHPLSANGQAYILRSAEGDSYAKMVFKEGDTSYNLTFTFNVQSNSASEFNSSAIEWATNLSDPECFDFDRNNKTECSGEDWDIKLVSAGRSITLIANGGKDSTGGNAAIYKLDSADTFDAVDLANLPSWDLLEPYKMQVTSYYNDLGVSGYYTIRYMPLDVNAE